MNSPDTRDPMTRRRLAAEQMPAAGATPPSPSLSWLALPEPFYKKLQQILDGWRFDHLVNGLCRRFYAAPRDRGTLLQASTYFRLLMLGLFEGIDSAEGIAWRTNDSVVLRRFLGSGREAPVPDAWQVTRTRLRIDASVHDEVFRWLVRALNDCVLAGDAEALGLRVEGCPPWERARRYPDFLRRFLSTTPAGEDAAGAKGAGGGGGEAFPAADRGEHRSGDQTDC